MPDITSGNEKEDTREVGEQSQHRGGLLLISKHGPAAIPAEFLIAFTRAMIRLNPSSDVFQLAAAQANKEYPITGEQITAFERAVAHEAERTIWPKGFFA